MTLPPYVMILGKRYQIIESSHIEECGLTEPHACTIYISTDINPQQVRDTLLHEIVHAIDYEMHLGMKERQVHCVATGLLNLFKDNPHLASELDIT